MNLNYYGINFSTRSDAENCLSQMLEIAARYGIVTLADVCCLVYKYSRYGDNKRYWDEKDLENAKVICLEDCYTIELPDSKCFDANKPSVNPDINHESSVKPTPESLNICIHINELDDPDSVLADTFKYIYTIKDRMVNLTIM